MTEIHLRLQDAFDRDIDQLRQLHYSDTPITEVTSKDALDDSSKHLVAYNLGHAIGAVRLTIEPAPVSQQGNHPRVARLTKSVVVKPWRRRGLYKLIMLETAILSFEIGCDIAIATIPLSLVTKKFLLSLGFEVVGKPTVVDNLPFEGTLLCENIQLNLRENMRKIIHARNELCLKLQHNNVLITSHY